MDRGKDERLMSVMLDLICAKLKISKVDIIERYVDVYGSIESDIKELLEKSK